MDKLRLNINGREVEGYKGQTILEIALENDIQIPTFCHDKRMETYGACGICVVEAEGSPKLLRACATEISSGMVIMTDTPRVRESRKLNLELLLSQHTGDCRAPCVLACPGNTDCQGYVGLIANGEIEEALELIKQRIPFAASVGRVCPHPCEEACRRNLVDEPISIMNLKRFAADIDLENPKPYLPKIEPPTGKSVAIVGGGAGGLSCAFYLAQMGHCVTVYEAMPKMGGMLRYGIPEYRLPKEIVDKEAALIEKMGVIFNNNIKIGRDRTFESLKTDFDAVVIAVGAWKSMELRCPGAELPTVYGGIDFLRKIFANEPLVIGNSVAVVGGGNTAMDTCRTAVRLGAKRVYVIYRRTEAEMPCDPEERTDAEEEGVLFKYLVSPIEVIGENGKVVQLRLQKMQLGEPDASGRRSPVAIEGDEELLEVDTVVAALGQGISPDGFDGISLTRGNTIIADEHMFTTNEKGVFAIGDCINDGAAIAIKAIGDAKRAAASVDGYLRGEDARYKAPYRVIRSDMTQDDFADIKKEPRARVSHLSPDERFDSFFEVTKRLDKNMAVREAARCLECGCHDYFECKLIALADQYDVHPERYRESVLKVAVEDNHPFIIRDPNKCILCGLCVRICSEVVGSTALGFVDRGFDTVVKPAFEDPLGETSCVSCGQCVSVCPTGALQERIPFIKPVPLDTKKTDSICGLCAVGCSTRVESHGNRLVKTTPARDRGINNGVMCGRGRFGLSYVYKDGRIITPMIRKKGVLEPASWNDALVHIAKKMESLAMRGEKTAVSIGQNYCVEDAGAVMNLAKLFNAEMFSFANRDNGLAMVLGSDASPNTLEEVLATGGIFVFGSSPMHNPVILARLREAARYGVPVTVVSADDDEFNISCDVIKVPNTTGFIKQVIKSLIDSGCKPKRAVGFDELRDSLAGITVGDGARTFAERYIAAKKAMVLFALGELSVAAAVEIANMAVVAGHIGSPRNGIYMLRQMSGSQTLADLGITATADALAGTKGLLVFGEDTDIRSDELEFLAVQDTHITDTAKHADVVLPLAVYPEIDGTYVNTERRIQHCRGVIKPPMAYRTSEIAQRIAEVVDASALAGDVRALYPSTRIGECSPTPVMHADGFGFDDNMARLTVAAESAFVEELAQTSYLMNAVTADMP